MRRILLSLCLLGLCSSASATPKAMTVDEIIAIAVTVPGFSYWWGGSKWKPGATDMGTCTPDPGTTGGCPKCTHAGSWGADCSGFVAKAWQIDKPMGLDVEYHPYSTVNFVNDTTWWTKIDRGSVVKGDALTHNLNGAGHIFLYEKGDPWGDMWAWECKGCAYGCTYNLRSASADFVGRRRVSIATSNTCSVHCEGNKWIGADCAAVDCAASGNSCVTDVLSARCVSPLCPSQGSSTICLSSGKLATCSDGVLGDAHGATCATTAADASSGDVSADGGAAPVDVGSGAVDSAALAADGAVVLDAAPKTLGLAAGGSAAHSSGCTASPRATAGAAGELLAVLALLGVAGFRRRRAAA